MRSAALGLALAASLAAAETEAAGVAVRASWYPRNLDVALGGQPLLERVTVEVQPRGADLPAQCDWQLPVAGPASTRQAVACRAGSVAGRLTLEEAVEGVLTLALDLDGETALAPQDGVLLTLGVAGFEAGTAFVRAEPWWMRPVFVRQQSFIPDEAQLILFRRARDYVVLLPLAAGGAIGWARGANVPVSAGGVTVALQARAPWSVRHAPLAVVAVGASPYAAVASAYRHGLAAMGNPGRLRGEKAYPEPFTRMGFCTWNTFYEQQTSANLLAAARTLGASGFPLGFFIIDAGWQQASAGSAFFQRLRGFGADPEKVPGGLKALVAELRAASGARWIGVWHALQGTPGGVDPLSPLATEQRDHLWAGEGGLIPDPTSAAGAGFYRDFYRTLRESGVDLVKVDFQNWTEPFLRGRVPLFQGLQQSQYNLQAAVREAFGDGLIDCMSMGNNVLFNLRQGSVVRSSLDYLLPAGPLGHRRHVINNVFNSLAVQQVAWPDFDMWEAYGDFAVYHSVLRALSGGPVYVTGDPGKQDWDLLRRLVLSDGTLLRTDDPVVPTRDALFVDAGAVRVPLKGFARVGAAGMLGAFNVEEAGAPVEGVARVADIEGLSGTRFAVREYFSRRVAVVGRDEPLPVRLAANQAALYCAVPVESGAAVFGLLEKYLAPRTVLFRQDDGRTLRVRVAEGGRLGVYLERPPISVRVDGAEVQARSSEGLLEVALATTPPRAHDVEIVR